MEEQSTEELLDQIGREFFGHIWRWSTHCEEITEKRIPELGEQLPKCVERLQRVTWLLAQLGTCGWGCRGGDHVIEYLITRSVGSILTSYRSIRTGFYDQSLTLTRSVGETANLLAMFHADAALRAEWTAADRKARIGKFGPVKIRLILEQMGALIPIEEDRYRELSEIGVHPVPGGRPQDFSDHGRGQIGGRYQESALFVAINELAVASFFLGFFGALQGNMEEGNRKDLLRASAALARSIGGLQITNWADAKSQILDMAKAKGSEMKLD